jgi:hypothetical protein
MPPYTSLLAATCGAALAFASIACAVDDESYEDADDEELVERSIELDEGLKHPTGLEFANGLQLADGTSLAQGLAAATGLGVAAGLDTEAGLSTTTGFMSTLAGQQFVQSLVECALPAGQSITKTDPVKGGKRVFSGAIGVGAAWKTGACDAKCQQQVSACLMARTNAIGPKVLVDMRSPIPQIGTAPAGTKYTIQEGAFFGNLFTNPPKAYTCKGVDGSFGIYESRTCANGGACGFAGLEDHCRDICKPGIGKTYDACKVGTTTYTKPITTYLNPGPYAAGCPAGCDACYDGTCAFICTPDKPCTAETFDCPAGWDCEALCSGSGACKGATLDCVGTNQCSLTCVDDNACTSTKVTCGASDCDVDCENAESCNGVEATVTGAGDVTMQCTGGASNGEACTDAGAGACSMVGC